MIKKTLLMTGISGLLGSNLLYALRDRYHIVGITHSKNIEASGVEILSVDLRDQEKVSALLQSRSFDIVLHAAAMANVDQCEEDKNAAYAANVGMTKNIVKSLSGSKAKLIHISTDLVYSGKKGNYSENDAVDPQNAYGQTKLEAEDVSLTRTGVLVLRTNFFGWNTVEKRSLAQWGIEQLTQGKNISGFTDVIFSSIYSIDLAQLLHAMIEKDLKGIYNFGSSSSMSKYQFLKTLAERLELDTGLIKPASVDEVNLKAKRAKNLSLNMTKLSVDLGQRIVTLEESIDHFVRDYQSNYWPMMANVVRMKAVV